MKRLVGSDNLGVSINYGRLFIRSGLDTGSRPRASYHSLRLSQQSYYRVSSSSEPQVVSPGYRLRNRVLDVIG